MTGHTWSTLYGRGRRMPNSSRSGRGEAGGRSVRICPTASESEKLGAGLDLLPIHLSPTKPEGSDETTQLVS